MDYYGALNVTKAANASEIKSKYRRLALQYHPDKLQGLEKKQQRRAEDNFKIIAEGKEVGEPGRMGGGGWLPTNGSGRGSGRGDVAWVPLLYPAAAFPLAAVSLATHRPSNAVRISFCSLCSEGIRRDDAFIIYFKDLPTS